MRLPRHPRKASTEAKRVRDNSVQRAKDAMGARLRVSGLRPTQQRIALAMLLFRDDHRHLTAETLHEEALASGVKVSLATVYNTLHQFTAVGLLGQIAVDASRSYFDTNANDHQHFYIADEGRLIDIPGAEIKVSGVPAAPQGLAVERVDVVVRLRRNAA
jgi:Fur family transcriptional regulator, iron response regulator